MEDDNTTTNKGVLPKKKQSCCPLLSYEQNCHLLNCMLTFFSFLFFSILALAFSSGRYFANNKRALGSQS